jgi:hypothetical protein
MKQRDIKKMSSNTTENQITMDFDNKYDLLGRIERVAAPPFLLTRIQQRIQTKKEYLFSPRIVWGLSLCMIIIMVVNFTFIFNQTRINKVEKNIAKEMNLIPNNELYNE